MRINLLYVVLALLLMLTSCAEDSETLSGSEDNTSESGFSELAYARYDQVDVFEYIYTKAAEIR